MEVIRFELAFHAFKKPRVYDTGRWTLCATRERNFVHLCNGLSRITGITLIEPPSPIKAVDKCQPQERVRRQTETLIA